KIKSDDRGARETQKKISQRADGDGMSDGSAFGFRSLGMSRIHFRPRAEFEAVEQVVGFDALAFPAANIDVLLLCVLSRNFVAQFLRATWGEGDHVISEMFQVVGFFVISEGAQARDDNLLRI